MRRLTFVAAAVALTLLGAAAPAAAHNTLISSDPEEDARIDTAPEQVTLTFDQPVQDAGVNQVAVTGPDGTSYATGRVRVDSAVVTAPIRPLGPAGTYVIGFRILSADGHPVSEELRFTLTKPGPGAGDTASGNGDQRTGAASTPAPEPAQAAQPAESAESDEGGVPVWVWLIAAAVLLGAGIFVALRMGSGRDNGSS